jgi:cation-transporting P-type ATPase E
VPAGTLVGVGVLASYLFALHPLRLPLIEARAVAVTVVIVLGLYLIVVLEATGLRRRTVVSLAVAVLAALYLVVLVAAPVRSFFELASPDAGIAATGRLRQPPIALRPASQRLHPRSGRLPIAA